MNLVKILSDEFKVKTIQIENLIKLLDEGNTIPFISRYRKEVHGSLDDQIIREVSNRLTYLRNFENRKNEIFNLISEQEKMNTEIEKALEEAKTLSELEDIYRPFRPKRKTRASVAKERGLLLLSEFIVEDGSVDAKIEARKYINIEKGVKTVDDAVAGALDIIAEDISDNAKIRKRLKNLLMFHAKVKSHASDKEKESVYSQYYQFEEPIVKIADHRILAIDRGEKEGFLKVSLDFRKEMSLKVIYSEILQLNQTKNICIDYIKTAAQDSYNRLIFPSIEREIRNNLTEKASEGAIKVFSVNLRQLLLQPPVKGKIIMGLDPGYRTGCKVAIVNAMGKVLDTNVVYPTHSKEKIEQSQQIIKDLILKHNVDIIAIGNGTASKETELFVVQIIKALKEKVYYIVVNEAGASVYSASTLAAKEFPDFDVTIRSAISIARRLQDPLAELVKIDPKSIGVGQYQHDMKKKRLNEALDGVVEDCVNSVGIDLNTASVPLLEKISGINLKVAQNIVSYREENGQFTSRNELKKVAKLGDKTFEQAAGFLRISESEDILDNTGIHPESYSATRILLKLLGYVADDLKNKKIEEFFSKVKNLDLQEVSEKLNIGIPTLQDIIKELLKPGRDPRDELPKPILHENVMEVKDLKPEMQLTGTVRNVIDFGAFIDIGVQQDGLVHISEICNKFIKHPSEVLKVGDVVEARVLSVDYLKNKISLSLKLE